MGLIAAKKDWRGTKDFHKSASLCPGSHAFLPYPQHPAAAISPASHLTLALAVHQEAILFFLLFGKGFVLLFVQEAVQGQAAHVLPVGTAGEIEFAVFMDVSFGQKEDSPIRLPNSFAKMTLRN
jgi:hypothetical protein